jgi:hypothetical protein
VDPALDRLYELRISRDSGSHVSRTPLTAEVKSGLAAAARAASAAGSLIGAPWPRRCRIQAAMWTMRTGGDSGIPGGRRLRRGRF